MAGRSAQILNTWEEMRWKTDFATERKKKIESVDQNDIKHAQILS